MARVELLYPFAENELLELMESYPSLEDPWSGRRRSRRTWARARTCRRGSRRSCPRASRYEYIGRPLRASPGEGYPAAHRAAQARIVRRALGLDPI